MRLKVWASALLLASSHCIAPNRSMAQTSDAAFDAALALISNFITRNCQRPAATGSRTEISGNAKIEAELKGLTKLLAGVGGDVGANAKRVIWDGVDQSQMAAAMPSGNDCAVKMTELLAPRLLPQRSATATEPDRVRGDTKQPDVATALYGVRRDCGQVLFWRKALHATPQGCLSVLSVGDVCRRLPQYLYCSYEAVPDSTAVYPVCHWTAKDCGTYFENVTALGKETRASPIRRVDCEQVLTQAAAKHYEAYLNAISSGQIVRRNPPSEPLMRALCSGGQPRFPAGVRK